MSNHDQLLKQPKTLIAIGSVSGLLLVIFVALGVIGGEDKTEPGNTAHSGQAISDNARLLKVDSQPGANASAWQGSVQARQAVKLAPKLPARIIEIAVHPGDRLKKGQLIARLDDRDLRAAFNAAQAAQQAAHAQAEQASSEQKRITDLFNKQAATRQHYEQVVAQAQAARATAKQAASNAQQSQVMLNENQIVAPFDGIVGERYQDPGDMGSSAQPIVSFYQANDFRLEASIPGQCLSQLQLDMPVSVRIDGMTDEVPGFIDEIAPDLDPQTHSRLLKVRLPKNMPFQHGQFGWLQLACQGQHNSLWIPATAIVHYGQLEAVKVVDNQHWQIRHIRSGKRQGDQVEVLSGLHAGETILTDAEVQP